ncbi:MAG: rRNA maturation RNase YbeY [Planctomycetes bacterium]|nr:rRNA maturation RNase YbeY [Planctomycetota bacterium]
MKGPDVRVSVHARGFRTPAALLARAVAVVLADHGVLGTVSIAVVDDRAIRRLNRRFLGHDYPTDCLSFDLAGGPDGPARGGPGPAAPAGEIVVSGETARREAGRRGIPFPREILLYAIHGALHLAGLDDRTARGRREMEARQEEYLAHFVTPLGHEMRRHLPRETKRPRNKARGRSGRKLDG